MIKPDATKIIKLITEFFDNSDAKQLQKTWNNDSDWTKFVIGKKGSSTIDSPLGNFIKEKLKTPIHYRKEDGLYDLTFATVNHIDKIPTLSDKYQPDFLNSSKYYDFYPMCYDILLEHENDIYRSWEEVSKLVYGRARLKVLITYNSDNTYINEERIMMIKTMISLISRMNNTLLEDSMTRYILMIGNLSDGKLNWYSKVLDTHGEVLV